MTAAILIVGSVLGNPTLESGRYLMDFDVGAHTGRGPIPTTDQLAKAKHFADPGEALEFWKTQSRVRPLRPDRLPNRPLTAYTVEIVEVP